jgi:hypothetical protein
MGGNISVVGDMAVRCLQVKRRAAVTRLRGKV